MVNDIIGPRIKRIRKNKGLTQEQLAESLGYSHNQLLLILKKAMLKCLMKKCSFY